MTYPPLPSHRNPKPNLNRHGIQRVRTCWLHFRVWDVSWSKPYVFCEGDREDFLTNPWSLGLYSERFLFIWDSRFETCIKWNANRLNFQGQSLHLPSW